MYNHSSAACRPRLSSEKSVLIQAIRFIRSPILSRRGGAKKDPTPNPSPEREGDLIVEFSN